MDSADLGHAHVTGSMLVPPFLTDARAALRAGRLTPAQYKQVEDRAVDTAIALQEGLGFGLINDGELRREAWTEGLLSSVSGVSTMNDAGTWKNTDDESPVEYPQPVVVDKIRRIGSRATEEFTYARARAHAEVKVTIPSPTIAVGMWSPQHTADVYPDFFDLVGDFAAAVRSEIEELARLGCRHIQIDAPDLSFLADPAAQEMLAKKGIPVQRVAAESIEIIDNLATVPGVQFSVHICRGNHPDAWVARGGYDEIVKQVIRRAPHIDRFLLEYTSPGVGTFEPLAKAPTDKQIVLGLVASKSRDVEPQELLEQRIRDAAQYFPLEQLGLSSSCGFENNVCTAADQQAKLTRIATVAHSVWN